MCCGFELVPLKLIQRNMVCYVVAQPVRLLPHIFFPLHRHTRFLKDAPHQKLIHVLTINSSQWVIQLATRIANTYTHKHTESHGSSSFWPLHIRSSRDDVLTHMFMWICSAINLPFGLSGLKSDTKRTFVFSCFSGTFISWKGPLSSVIMIPLPNLLTLPNSKIVSDTAWCLCVCLDCLYWPSYYLNEL